MKLCTQRKYARIIALLDMGYYPKDIVTELNLSSVWVVYRVVYQRRRGEIKNGQNVNPSA